MRRRPKTNYLGFILRLLVITIMFVTGILLYRRCTHKTESRFELAHTPLVVEQIRSILELNTIKFRDEVVVDSLEYYASAAEVVSGSLQKLTDPDQMKHAFNREGIRRRLTLIVRGELLYGVDLSSKKFRVEESDSLITIHLPEPRLLTLAMTPNQTEIYIENGVWSDNERKALEKNAERRMKATGERLQLAEKSKAGVTEILKRLVGGQKEILVVYE